MDFVYFNLKYAIKMHDKVIDISGGFGGVRDVGLIESTIEHLKNNDYYPNISAKLNHLVFSIAMNHAFSDGNKRSAIALGAFFLNLNGYDKRVGVFIVEMENIIVWLVEGKIEKRFLEEIIDSLIENGELTEEVKIKLLKRVAS